MARDYENYSKDALIVHIHELEKQLKNNKYGLYWDKSIEQEEVVRQCKNNIPVLKRKNDKCMLNDPEADTHILIEGDNFHALTAMNMMCGNEGFVDVIYIDPPYNTGKKDFTYNDKYVGDDDGFFHSKWLSFMEGRLRLARTILTDGGVIFISIDDNEQAQLKLLCNSIFGERNFIAQVIWERAYAPVNLKKHFSENHDYILGYAKNKDIAICNGLPRSDAQNKDYKNPDNDPRGPWKAGNPSVGPAVEKNVYEIISPSGRSMYPPSGRSWLYSKERFQEMIDDNRIFWGKDGNSVWAPKMFLSEVKQGVTPMTIWKYQEVGHSQDATKELKDLFGGASKFSYPKSVRLIKRIISLYSQKDSIVLDFFAGSGTTGQAVLELNKEDGGDRHFILCTNNEGDICTDVTYPRITTVITGRRQDGSEYSDGIPANLMYYKTDFINDSRDTDQAKYCLVEKVDELLCIIEETYVAKERTDHFSHYESLSGDKHTFIYSEYYNDLQFAEFIDHINAASGDKAVYMFSTDNSVDAKLFEGLDDVTVKPIPSKIYEIYKEIVEDIKRGEQ